MTIAAETAHLATPIDGLAIDDTTQRRLFLDARSNTEFSERDVPDTLIRSVFDLVKWGPTSNNTTPMRVAIARSEDARAAVISNAAQSNRAKLAKSPVLLVVARDNRFHDHFSVTSPGSEATAARLEAAPERRAALATTGSWLQGGYLIVGLRAAGLAVRPYGGFDAEGLDEALFADSSWSSIMLLGVGYPPPSDSGAGLRRGRVSANVGVVSF
ncbi:malonic semialdehyde reductase [Demequina aurantiaca]|uniref:malonic semialdehyde reductase n=1 Tax=Demequina aurantiaca TaxID=676200 RepID=UPI003D32C795